MANNATQSALHIQGRKRSQNIAHFIIWGASILTIGVLFVIIGYILFRGFYSSNIKNYSVLSIEEASFEGYMLVVNRKIRLKEMPISSTVDAYVGEHIDWGKLSEQEYELAPCLVDPALPDGGRMLDSLGISADDLTPLALVFPDAAQALATVARNLGAFAVVPVDTPLPRNTKRLNIRRVSIAVNPEVVKLVDNTKLRILDQSQIKALFSGRIANWRELGGLDLPVTLVLPSESSSLAALAAAQGYFPADATPAAKRLKAASIPDQLELLKSEPGAVTLFYTADALRSRAVLLSVERRERGTNLTLDFLIEEPKMSGRVGGISTIIINTLIMILLTLSIATPIGVSAAIYLVEYSRQSRLVNLLRLGTETLAGIPSIIFGLFGMIFFVNILGWGIGLFSGVLTLTLMILPTIVRTSEEALKSVPMSMREGSLALGASKLQTVLRVAVPAAMPGILTGVILSLGRAVGETAALIFTMGSNYEVAGNLFSSARVLAVHVYLIVAEGISMDKAFATATILVFIILFVNLTTTHLIGRFNTMAGK